ncbi:hypothetical protein ACX80D_16395 [Arthrobacter sp. Sr24]
MANPDLTTCQLEYLKALRAAWDKSFSAKNLGEVSPETMAAIFGHLNQDDAR